MSTFIPTVTITLKEYVDNKNYVVYLESTLESLEKEIKLVTDFSSLKELRDKAHKQQEYETKIRMRRNYMGS